MIEGDSVKSHGSTRTELNQEPMLRFPFASLPAGFIAMLLLLPGVILCARIVPGSTVAEMVAELGEPTAQIETGSKIIYSYPQGTIRTEAGVVLQVSEGFYGKLNAITRKTASGESISLVPDEPAEISVDPVLAGLWLEDYDAVKERAVALERPILMWFTGSDWCIWCKRLEDEHLSRDVFKTFAKENLVLLKLDFPRNIAQSDELKAQNQTLREAWNINGYPTLIMTQVDGSPLGQRGYLQQSPEAFVADLRAMMEGTVEDASANDNQMLRDFLGEDFAGVLDQLAFTDWISGSAISLSLQLLMGSFLTFFVIRRIIKR